MPATRGCCNFGIALGNITEKLTFGFNVATQRIISKAYCDVFLVLHGILKRAAGFLVISTLTSVF